MWTFPLFTQAKENAYFRNDPYCYLKRPTQQTSQTTEKTPNKWTFFCDFPEITHVAITEANVCICTQDNRCMVRVLVYPLMLKP